MNKRFLSWLLAILMLLTAVPALAEPADGEPVEIVVGSTNQMSGYFFTDMWGNNTADIDVRALLHGYSTVAISRNGTYEVDQTVVREITLSQLEGSPDKTYTIEINPGLTYNDATPILASDYVFSVLFQAAPEIFKLGGIPSGMRQFVGYDAYASGESNVFAGVRLLDDTHFALSISGDHLPYFYELLYVNVTPYPIGAIAPGYEVADDGEGAYLRRIEEGEAQPAEQAAEESPEESPEKVPEEAVVEAPEEAAGNADAPELLEVLEKSVFDPETGYLFNPKVTSGPYQLVGYDADAHTATFEINPNYLGNFEGRKPTIDRIVFKQVYNDSLMDELANGTVDIVNKVTAGDVISDGLTSMQQNQLPLKVVNYLRAGYGFLGLSCEYGVTQSQNVRQALAYLTDANGFVTEFLHGYGLRTYSYYGYGQWMAVSMLDQLNAELNNYGLDLGKAVELLEADGFTLNADGEAYDAAAGGVRYRKDEAGNLEPLAVKWAALSNNPGSQAIQQYTIPHMQQAGFQVEVEELSFSELLTHYYRQTERTYNVFYLATNFDFIFDPYYTFNPDASYQGERNTSGIADEELFRLATELRRTEVGDNQGYLEKWYQFEKRFNEVLPTIPLYSNVYFDFFNPELYSYQPSAYYSWASAILYATYGYEEVPEVVEPVEPVEGAGEGEAEIVEIP
ncbi:MAG: ABC transporter substrate-binding protein [Clostridiales bacterium]|nr:ABC transporter substrate-binding protein [Clostridiales bacterium]